MQVRLVVRRGRSRAGKTGRAQPVSYLTTIPCHPSEAEFNGADWASGPSYRCSSVIL